MHGPKTILMFLLAGAAALGADFSGASALEYTRRAVALGPRPPGSAAIRKLQTLIAGEARAQGARVEEDNFTAQTPIGPVAMKNIIARFGGGSGRVVVLTGHYDTKHMLKIRFVGANDGGASTGFLLEMARTLAGRNLAGQVWLVWFDGEEAFGDWSATDGIYGSRHLAARWAGDGTLPRVKALINVDMIGDKNLGILEEWNSTAALRKLVWQAAADLGYARHFLNSLSAVEDDHMPFLRQGAPALNLIDFDYPPWHTAGDTLDKLDAASFTVVGQVVHETLRRLQRLP
ncbi:MAG: M28 family peptidase [Acidobacteria bacterium]|nr:M28 family peptidase [Acidobacteriota bacterium]